jgi:hypothetical protein
LLKPVYTERLGSTGDVPFRHVTPPSEQPSDDVVMFISYVVDGAITTGPFVTPFITTRTLAPPLIAVGVVIVTVESLFDNDTLVATTPFTVYAVADDGKTVPPGVTARVIVPDPAASAPLEPELVVKPTLYTADCPAALLLGVKLGLVTESGSATIV